MQAAMLQQGNAGPLSPTAGLGFGLGGDRLLQGSGFALNRATSSGGVLSFWSRSASSSFYGQDGPLALNGDVRSTLFGVENVLQVLELSGSCQNCHASGEGQYE